MLPDGGRTYLNDMPDASFGVARTFGSETIGKAATDSCSENIPGVHKADTVGGTAEIGTEGRWLPAVSTMSRACYGDQHPPRDTIQRGVSQNADRRHRALASEIWHTLERTTNNSSPRLGPQTSHGPIYSLEYGLP